MTRFDIQRVRRDMEAVVQYMSNILDDVLAEHKLLSEAADDHGHGREDKDKDKDKDFLQILSELQGEAKSELSGIGLPQLKSMIQDIILGGTDTTTTTVELAMAEMLRNPRLLSKAQAEVSEVVGADSIVEEHHLPKLHYIQAVIKEVLRLHPPAPLLVPRRPSEAATVGGYTVPANSKIIINAWDIHRDPSHWDSPLEFRPERFLPDGGAEKCDYTGNVFHYIPFGSGRRICPAVPLAERMMAYFLASLLHSFDWNLPPGQDTIDMSVHVGIVLRKKVPLRLIPTPRLSHPHLYC
ncbi:flavonoid 3'-monooxygenase CYP75B137-like [Andrographis paniculata]|uniref:flavonoid 3'-monooxygenase CYP75B137-like n=1 Tax=Andrographis paniculata TaxID=175694 RepID=UPI0021E724BD|nr:flavonoid 3'-monooxygenase CYP75B137-like [Andrographis paniculata]